MKKIMWLCDMSGSFMNHFREHINPDVMDQLLSFKDNYGDVIAMATDSTEDDAKLSETAIARQRSDQQSPFDIMIHFNSFNAWKEEKAWWQSLHQTYGDDYTFIMLDNDDDIRNMAAKFDVSTVEISQYRPSEETVQDVNNTRQVVAQSLVNQGP